MAGKYVRLLHQNGSFTDPHSSFHIAGGEVGLLPDKLSPLMKEWLNAGGLVFCDAPGSPPEEEPEKEEKLPSVKKRKPGRPKGSTKKK